MIPRALRELRHLARGFQRLDGELDVILGKVVADLVEQANQFRNTGPLGKQTRPDAFRATDGTSFLFLRNFGGIKSPPDQVRQDELNGAEHGFERGAWARPGLAQVLLHHDGEHVGVAVVAQRELDGDQAGALARGEAVVPASELVAPVSGPAHRQGGAGVAEGLRGRRFRPGGLERDQIRSARNPTSPVVMTVCRGLLAERERNERATP